MKIIFLIFISLAIKLHECVKSGDVCLISEEECKGLYDQKNKYQVKCIKEKCNGQFKYQCGIDYCSTSAHNCEQFLNLNILLRSFMKTKMNENKIFSIKTFIKSVKNCPANTYEWQEDSVCINGKNCYAKQTLPLRYDNVRLVKKIDCLCKKTYSYQCNYGYCAVNNKACDFFTLKQLNSTFTIKSCGNDNKVYKFSY